MPQEIEDTRHDILRAVQAWLQEPHAYPIAPAAQEAITAALQACLLEDHDDHGPDTEPLLLVALLGGSGTGKSTLFNALAGATLAATGVQRPTTTVPMAYVHKAIPEHRLAAYPPLQHIQIVRHQRDGLRHKILIDTPDFDTHQAVTEHRQAVLDLVPYCDLVLFVVSPEKYVDLAAWDMLLPQIPQHGFAFVLTKDDLLYDDGGVPPETHIRAMLKESGYEQLRLYRVKAEQWLAYRTGTRQEPPQGDALLALEHWLEEELRRDDVAVLKATLFWRKRERLRQALLAARPPELEQTLGTLRTAWEQSLRNTVEVLDSAVQAPVRAALSRLQMDVVMEHHRQFRGLLGVYFALVDLLRYGPSLLVHSLRREPDGVAYVLDRVTDVLQSAWARETWQQLHLTLRHRTGELTLETGGTTPLRWISKRLATLEQEGPTFLRQALPTLLVDLQTPPMAANRLVRLVQQTLKGLFEFLPLVFVLLCGYQLAVSFWQGNYLGGPFLLHAGALLLLLCLLVHGGVALVFPLAWQRRHRRFTSLLSEQFARLLRQRYRAVLDELGQALRQEQASIDHLCAQIEAQSSPQVTPQHVSLKGLLATPEESATMRQP